ncbi:DNA-binding protein-like protein HGH1 [Dothidotthia symphoricarpi CBS 119687]|uniref:Protein HGH1 homolog n=1 Tax=Dothidotthia symphoricarpi CBS 119687 TaxID=1392245 RepID=A0A6A6AMM3_9PLEO|nr:DNA-binding protein-like protein HGH1 [Dothidotthia symphoricarpi CBS 119687]KAF2133179.1 DNA-binding protein-like protein HGH1 [Dothidotthia symphoricarpi CBS 119687]
MPTELEDLVEFLHHGNTQIRQAAVEHLVGYSQTDVPLFKRNQLEPVKDLKLLVKDYAPIAKNAFTILINISSDTEITKTLAKDDAFLETLLSRITNPKERNANEIAMLLANLAKDDSLQRVLELKRDVPKELSKSKWAMDQLMDCFVKGAEGAYNKHADFDYLSYFFADLAKFPKGREYLTTPQEHDGDIIPITKIQVFTDHASHIRRLGVASAIKNVAFLVPAHPVLLSNLSPDPTLPPPHIGANLLPYILLPLMGPEEYADDDTEGMLDELQLLEPDKEREKDVEIMKAHLETLLLLSTTKEGRQVLRKVKVYPIVRECHIQVENEDVREACDRVVQVIMRDEEGEESEMPQASAYAGDSGKMMALKNDEEEDEDEKIVDIL